MNLCPIFFDPALVFEMPTPPLEVEQRVLNLFCDKVVVDTEPNPCLFMKIYVVQF